MPVIKVGIGPRILRIESILNSRGFSSSTRCDVERLRKGVVEVEAHASGQLSTNNDSQAVVGRIVCVGPCRHAGILPRKERVAVIDTQAMSIRLLHSIEIVEPV